MKSSESMSDRVDELGCMLLCIIVAAPFLGLLLLLIYTIIRYLEGVVA